MKVISKFAEFVGYTIYHGERFNEWRCPNKKCGFSVSEDYTCCPYCGQRIKFKEPPKDKMIKLSIMGIAVMNYKDNTQVSLFDMPGGLG